MELNTNSTQRIRPLNKKTRFWVDNEILEIFAKQLKPQGISIYCSLARHANSKTQMCFPSYERIMQTTGIGKRNTISKYLKKIEELNLIRIIRNKKRQPNKYILLRVDMNSIQKVTTDNIQKGNIQYTNSNNDHIVTDTLSNISNSNKEGRNFLKEEVKESSIAKFKPDFLKKKDELRSKIDISSSL